MNTTDSARLERLNVENLTAMWARMGATRTRLSDGTTLFASRTWPHRRWIDWGARPSDAELAELAELVRAGAPGTFAAWPPTRDRVTASLRSVGFDVQSEVLAMVRDPGPPPPTDGPCLAQRRVRTVEQADLWTRLAAESFGYVVDPAVPRALLSDDRAELYLAMRDDEAVGTSMLYLTPGAVGIHMMGVPRAHRRQGIARGVMHALLRRAAELGRDPLVLQASRLGAPLYRSLGFREQLAIPYLSLVQSD